MQSHDLLPSVYITIEILVNEHWIEVAMYPLKNICILLGRNRALKEELGDIRIDRNICDESIYNKISSIHLTLYRRSITEKENNKYQKVVGYAVKDGHNEKPSTNGTLLNGKPLKQKINLVNGDILQLGQKIRIIYHQKLGKNNISDDLKGTDTGSTEREPGI